MSRPEIRLTNLPVKVGPPRNKHFATGGHPAWDKAIPVFGKQLVEVGLEDMPEALLEVDADPNGMTDFQVFAALAYTSGTATDKSGHTYTAQTDIRAYQGEYVKVDGDGISKVFGGLPRWQLFSPGERELLRQLW